jgi:hypothetical protein
VAHAAPAAAILLGEVVVVQASDHGLKAIIACWVIEKLFMSLHMCLCACGGMSPRVGSNTYDRKCAEWALPRHRAPAERQSCQGPKGSLSNARSSCSCAARHVAEGTYDRKIVRNRHKSTIAIVALSSTGCDTHSHSHAHTHTITGAL